MNRFELKCYMCNQIIGYMSLPANIAVTGNHTLRATEDQITHEREAIRCPICETRWRTVEEMTNGQQ